MPAKVGWTDVDLAAEMTLTIGTGDAPVEIETGIVMKRGVAGAMVIVMERGVDDVTMIAMVHGVDVETVTATEHGVGVVRLTAMGDGVALTDRRV